MKQQKLCLNIPIHSNGLTAEDATTIKRGAQLSNLSITQYATQILKREAVELRALAASISGGKKQ